MKSSPIRHLRLLSLCLLVIITGCRKKPNQNPVANDLYNDLPPVGQFDGMDETGLPGDRGDFSNMSPVDSSMFAPVYFGYDSASVTEGELGKVRQVAEHLNRNSRQALILQGHTDERGSREYNLALGERRALAVREILLTFGVSAERIQTLSLGEEQAAVAGSDESAWSLNRRVEFQLMQ